MPDEAQGYHVQKVQSRLSEWRGVFKLAHRGHYVVGTLGLICGAAAQFTPDPYTKGLAALAGLCAAIVTFVEPKRIYRRFVKPWRILDSAMTKYHAELITDAELISTLQHCELVIEGVEAEEEERAAGQ